MSWPVIRFTPRTLLAVAAIGGGLAASIFLFGADPAASTKRGPKPLQLALFEALLEQHQDLTYDQLTVQLGGDRNYLEKLSFDPTQAKYFDRVAEKLALTDAERQIFRQRGMVSIDLQKRHTFASAYFQIYSQDLPVLVTTDSILHALHRSYDEILMQLELTLFSTTVGQILEDCHASLERKAAANKEAPCALNCRDADLYLTVARNLLAGAGAADAEEKWSGELLVHSPLGQDQAALVLLKNIQSLQIQIPDRTPPTAIYGGTRFVDYSQFRPRGHYTKQPALKRYFRTLMWLSRIDCGWNVLPTDQTPGIVSDSDRELRNAALLVELLRDTDSLKRLAGMDDILRFLVGQSDNLSVFALSDLLQAHGVRSLAELDKQAALERLKEAVKEGKSAQQMIRSQLVVSDPSDPYYKVPPPAAFQMFGQRFVVDSFVLSQVVFDSIVFENRKQKRMMPAGLDVMAALGNNEAVPLLRDDLNEFNYSANLLACRDYVNLHTPEFWQSSLYNIWLDALRTLDDDLSNRKHVPEVMQTRGWQRKQLQSQLGSWAELRHDTILYAKQSSTAQPACEYPAGYVEPYPEFFARVRYFAEEAARRFKNAEFPTKDAQQADAFRNIQKYQTAFFQKMAGTLGQLEKLAGKELQAEPFSDEEQVFLKKLIDRRGGGSGPPQYDGWYCELFYNRAGCSKWEPTIVDVHTDPESESCLEVGIGDVNFGLIAIDNEQDRAVYAGPLFSYYEFRHPVDQRLTDSQWQEMIALGRTPARPEWVRSFQAPARDPNGTSLPAPIRRRRE